MFGILYTAFQGICGLIGGIKNIIDDESAKQRTYNRNNDTYMDRRGYLHDGKTSKTMLSGITPNGDRIITDPLTHYTRNLDQEKREKKYNELKNNNPNGITVSLYSNEFAYIEGRKANRKGMAGGYWYKDLNNGKIYVKRFLFLYPDGKIEGKGTAIKLMYFYMDKDSGKIIRVADKEWERLKNNYEIDKMKGIIKNEVDSDEYIDKLKVITQQWIKDFNCNQDKKREQFELECKYKEMSKWDYELFYNDYFCDKREGAKS